MSSPTATTVHLRAADVSVLLEISDARLPQIVHWGEDLGELTQADAAATVGAHRSMVAANNPDVPLRACLLPEPSTGWAGRPGLVGHRDGTDWATRFTVTDVTLDGRAITGFATATASVGGPPLQVRVQAADDITDLSLVLQIELLSAGLLRSRAELINDGLPYTLDDLVLTYPLPAQAREVLDFAGRWGKEKTPQRHHLSVGQHLREGRKGRTGADAAGILHVGTPGFDFGSGQIWGVHTAFSGNHTHLAERLSTGFQHLGGGELLLPGEVRLEQGQSYLSPWIYGAYGIGLDAVAARFHNYLRSRPTHVDTSRPVTLNVWEAVYFDHDLDRLLDLADRAAAVGVERFVLDDGWFGSRRDDLRGLGDWTVSTQAWPSGLGPLVDRVRELGMEFGLWVEPEMVNLDSDLARAHPDWVMSARPGQLPVESRHQQVLNLAIPQCYAHIRDALSSVLSEYDIGYVKWDHNRDLVEPGNQLAGGRPIVHEQTLAFYRLVQELKAAHPGLEIESCSSGGSRVDLGVMEHCDRVWVSDCIDPLDRQQMNRWTMQLLPPELMGNHIASGRSHTTGRIHDLSFRATTALIGHLGIEWDLAAASDDELRELASWIAYYRGKRDLLLSGKVVRSDTGDDTLSVYGVVSPDGREALYVLATTARSDVSPRPPVRLPGLEPTLRYDLRPVVIGAMPHGLEPPPWWNVPVPAQVSDPVRPYAGLDLAGVDIPGATFLGSTLIHSGVQPPLLDPEQAVVLEVHAR